MPGNHLVVGANRLAIFCQLSPELAAMRGSLVVVTQDVQAGRKTLDDGQIFLR